MGWVGLQPGLEVFGWGGLGGVQEVADVEEGILGGSGWESRSAMQVAIHSPVISTIVESQPHII